MTTQDHLVTANASAAQCLCGWHFINFQDEQAVRAAAREHVRQTYGQTR